MEDKSNALSRAVDDTKPNEVPSLYISCDQDAAYFESGSDIGSCDSIDAVMTHEKINNDEEEFCPLFMVGLPKDFDANPGLAAIASLLNDDDDDNNHKTRLQIQSEAPRPVAGGGKLSKMSSKLPSLRHKPYAIPKKQRKATLGEAQLFLQLWRI